MRKITALLLAISIVCGLAGCGSSTTSEDVQTSSVVASSEPASESPSEPEPLGPIGQMALDGGISEADIPVVLDFIDSVGGPDGLITLQEENGKIDIRYLGMQVYQTKAYLLVLEDGAIKEATDGYGLSLIHNGDWVDSYYDYSGVDSIGIRDETVDRINELIAPDVLELPATELEPYLGWSAMPTESSEHYQRLNGVPVEYRTFYLVDIFPEDNEVYYYAIYLPTDDGLELHGIWYGADKMG